MIQSCTCWNIKLFPSSDVFRVSSLCQSLCKTGDTVLSKNEGLIVKWERQCVNLQLTHLETVDECNGGATAGHSED